MNKIPDHNFMLAAFLSVLKDTGDFIFIKDTDLVYQAASDSFARMVGMEWGEQLIGKTDLELFPEPYAKRYIEDDYRLLQGDVDRIQIQEQVPFENSTIKTTATSKCLIVGAQGQVLGICGIARDITMQVELERERERNRLSSRLFDCVLEGDVDNDRVLCLEGPKWMTGQFDSEQVSFQSLLKKFSKRLIRRDQQKSFVDYYQQALLQIQYSHKELEGMHLTLIRMGGKVYRWVQCTSRLYRSKVTDTLCISIFMKDVDDEVRSKQFLMEKAVTDALTGLNNRESVLEQISLCLKECGERSTHALLFIDLDGFKQVNDQLGHQFGDQVLQEFSARLKFFFREDDVIGRIGGDEFLVFLKQVGSKHAVEERVNHIVKALSAYYGEPKLLVTCSIGIAICRNGEIGMNELYHQADEAMYRAKENGKNRIFFYEDMD